MDDDWDSENIDWDQKAEEVVKEKADQKKADERAKKAEILALNSMTTGMKSARLSDESGNYYEENQQKKKLKEQQNNQRRAQTSRQASESSEEIVYQPYSYKDLIRIRDYTKKAATFHILILETFGKFERFLLTHQEPNLSDETIVELLNIDVKLLEIPFKTHNQLLLKELANLPTFWSQLISFMENFFKNKQKDLNFLLVVDMNGFFDNIECLLHSLLVNNFFNSAIENVMKKVLTLLESFPDNEWCKPDRLTKLQLEYQKNLKELKIYDVS